ncbi:MAG TPA: Fic family protein [Steroidobacteraceae bacterium]
MCHRAVPGYWLFGYIHPYPDGNGRMARFLMNAMLASGGYPWCVIRVENRDGYLTALDPRQQPSSRLVYLCGRVTGRDRRNATR